MDCFILLFFFFCLLMELTIFSTYLFTHYFLLCELWNYSYNYINYVTEMVWISISNTSNKTSWMKGTFQNISVGWIRKNFPTYSWYSSTFEKADEVLVTIPNLWLKKIISRCCLTGLYWRTYQWAIRTCTLQFQDYEACYLPQMLDIEQVFDNSQMSWWINGCWMDKVSVTQNFSLITYNIDTF